MSPLTPIPVQLLDLQARQAAFQPLANLLDHLAANGPQIAGHKHRLIDGLLAAAALQRQGGGHDRRLHPFRDAGMHLAGQRRPAPLACRG